MDIVFDPQQRSHHCHNVNECPRYEWTRTEMILSSFSPDAQAKINDDVEDPTMKQSPRNKSISVSLRSAALLRHCTPSQACCVRVVIRAMLRFSAQRRGTRSSVIRPADAKLWRMSLTTKSLQETIISALRTCANRHSRCGQMECHGLSPQRIKQGIQHVNNMCANCARYNVVQSTVTINTGQENGIALTCTTFSCT